jgi:hypothetical protein
VLIAHPAPPLGTLRLVISQEAAAWQVSETLLDRLDRRIVGSGDRAATNMELSAPLGYAASTRRANGVSRAAVLVAGLPAERARPCPLTAVAAAAPSDWPEPLGEVHDQGLAAAGAEFAFFGCSLVRHQTLMPSSALTTARSVPMRASSSPRCRSAERRSATNAALANVRADAGFVWE